MAQLTFFMVRLSGMAKLMGKKLKKYDTGSNFMMFWNLSIFVCCKNLRVKTSSSIKKQLPNFTKVMKGDKKCNHFISKSERQKYNQNWMILFRVSFEKRNSEKFSSRAFLICALLIQQPTLLGYLSFNC